MRTFKKCIGVVREIQANKLPIIYSYLLLKFIFFLYISMIFCVRSEDSVQGRSVSDFLFRSYLLFYVENRVHGHICFLLLYQVLRLIKEEVRPKSKLYENPSCTYVKNTHL